jgi:hypothetical protein
LTPALSVGRVLTVICAFLTALCAAPAHADWMLVANHGEKPNRVAVYVDLTSLRSDASLEAWRAVIDAPLRERGALPRDQTVHTMAAVEILESSQGPASRYHELAVNSEKRTCLFSRTLEWSRDGSLVERAGTGWQEVSGWTEKVYQLVVRQPEWKQALVALLQRTQREKTVVEQTELAPFGFEYVLSGDLVTLGDLTWNYVWSDGERPPASPGLAEAQRALPPRGPGAARLEGEASYFLDSVLEDRGWKIAPPGTQVYLYFLEPRIQAQLLALPYRVGVHEFADEFLSPLPAEVMARRRETRVFGEQGQFVFDNLEPGLYVIEFRVPYRGLMSHRVVDGTIEERAVYEDGSYDVLGSEEVTHREVSWQWLPGNWTREVIEVLPGATPTRIRVSNIRQ